MLELGDEDEDIARELQETIDKAAKQIEQLELERMLGGEYDANGAILSINAGAGGTESQDWAQMVQRMLMRWAERKGFKVQILDLQVGDEAGIKSATIGIDGMYAYGYCRAEVGVHRLVRSAPMTPINDGIRRLYR